MRPAARVTLAVVATPGAALALIVGGRLWTHARNEIQAAKRAKRRARARQAREAFAVSRRPGGGAVVFRNHLDHTHVSDPTALARAAHAQDMADMAGTEGL